MEFIVSQVWRTRCAVTGRRIGGQSLMVLTRWNPNAPLTPYNLVLVQQSVLPFVENLFSSSSEVTPQSSTENPLTPEVIQRINDRLNWAKTVCENDWPPRGISDAELQKLSSPCLAWWCHWFSFYRGPLILIPSSLAVVVILQRCKR